MSRKKLTFLGAGEDDDRTWQADAHEQR